MQSISKKPNKPQEVRSANKKPQSKPAKEEPEKYEDDWGLSDKKEPAKAQDAKEPPVKIDFFGTDDQQNKAENAEKNLLDAIEDGSDDGGEIDLDALQKEFQMNNNKTDGMRQANPFGKSIDKQMLQQTNAQIE